MYSVKEIYYTLQGEGAQTGRAAVFLRFAGCNLWSGREIDRAQAVCRFCDTDFVGVDGPGGGRFRDAAEVAAAVATCWERGRIHRSRSESYGDGDPVPRADDSAFPLAHHPAGATEERSRRYVVCTGGEPLLQLDAPLIDALYAAGFEVAVETNGTIPAPPGIDWICVSPKAAVPLAQRHGNELKLVYPQVEHEPEVYAGLDFTHFFLQPMDGPDQATNIRKAADYCLRHPQWRLSLQTHKLAGLP